MQFIKSLLLLLISMITIIVSLCKEEVQEEQKIINQHEVVINEIIPVEEEDNILATVSFVRQNVNRTIKDIPLQEALDENSIGILDLSYDIEESYGNIVLSGHNNNEAFHVLYDLKIGDEIKLTTKNKVFYFTVTLIDKIKEDDFKYFHLSSSKILTLITCTPDNKHRLIVQANEK